MFGVFTNNYANVVYVNQNSEIYVGLNSLYNGYVGNEILASGTNPFIPAPTPTPSDDGMSTLMIWVIVLSCVSFILLIGCGIACYKWRSAAK